MQALLGAVAGAISGAAIGTTAGGFTLPGLIGGSLVGSATSQWVADTIKHKQENRKDD